MLNLDEDVQRQSATVTSLGNAGIHVKCGKISFLIDPFFRGFEGRASSQWEGARRIEDAGMILITHAHWDHFNPDEVANSANRTGAVVVGPAAVIAKLKGLMPARGLIEAEPRAKDPSGKYACLKVEMAGMKVTAFRTSHGSGGHNSYLVEVPGLRLFHDGDNEHTDRFDFSTLVDLDALMLCPWHGSGWAAFIERIKPGHWFLIHMTADEIDEHARGEFLPQICDCVPMDAVALRPGESALV